MRWLWLVVLCAFGAAGCGEASKTNDDEDGDGIPDVVEGRAERIDTDGDGIPDYLDEDSDNDRIADEHDENVDTDGDGTPDFRDLDSDDDGLSDADEAGDSRLESEPYDTDGDGTPDFRDLDSDDDGLSDADEKEYGTNARDSDTDNDGVPDVVEIVGCAGEAEECRNDATDPDQSPRTRGTFIFFSPYNRSPVPERETLSFGTDLKVADVYFLIDTTSSMQNAIANVRDSLTSEGGIIDQVREQISDVRFGVGGFEDYAVSPYGNKNLDQAYYHLQDITDDAQLAQDAVNALSIGNGADYEESLIPALWSAITGRGLEGRSGWTRARRDSEAGRCASGTRDSWPCFRSGAVPVFVAITNSHQHNMPGSPAYDPNLLKFDRDDPNEPAPMVPTQRATVDALTKAGARVVGVAVDGGGIEHLEWLARDTGAVDLKGNPLVSQAESGEVSNQITNQIRTLAQQSPFDISIVLEDDKSDRVDSGKAFVARLEANTKGDARRGCAPAVARDTNKDGFPDTFTAVTPGTRVCFDIVLKRNETVMPRSSDQIFRGTLRVLGDGFTELDRRDLFFLVPPPADDLG